MSITDSEQAESPSITEKFVLETLRPINDPDLRKSIVDLGFIQNIAINGANVAFDLELTTPACPVKDQLKQACIDALMEVDSIDQVDIQMTARTRGSMMQDRQLLKDVKYIIGIASGKGGVGKSTSAVNIAVALHQAGAKVGLLDADIYGPSLPTMLTTDTLPRPSGPDTIEPASSQGMKVISIGYFIQQGQAAILRGPMVSGYVTQFISKVDWGELDYLLIDYPPGTGDIQLTLSQQAPLSGAVIVTTPQDISLVDVDRAIQMFETTRVPVLGVCETMSYFLCDGCGKRHNIFRSGGGEYMASQAGVPFLGGIPIDAAVAESSDAGKPIVKTHPDSEVAKAYVNIAGKLATQLSILSIEGGDALDNFTLEWKQE